MTLQEKFMAQMAKIAEDRQLDFVIQPDWANTGTAMFQKHDSFKPLISFTYQFAQSYMTFEGIRNPRVVNPASPGNRWPAVKPSTLDEFIEVLVDDLDAALDPALADSR